MLKDPILVHDRDVQKAQREIQTLKCVSDLNNFQAQVLSQYKAMIENDMSVLKRDIMDLKEESRRSQELRDHMIRAGYSFVSLVKNSSQLMCSYLIKCAGVNKRLLTPWLVILLLCSCVTILDPRSYKDGEQN